jgi:16S rRNA (uracil1498-N3)-methyltransferase
MGLGIIRPTQMAWACEKSAELGCWDIIPVVCKNSQRMISPSEIERLNRVTLSAMKQSGTLYHTRVLSPLPLKDLLAEFTAKAEIFFADPTGFSTQRILNFSLSTTANQLLFLVGPEGGFTAEEIEYFQEVKGSAVSLGENRLRSETAAVVGIAFLMAKVSK